MSQLAVAIFPHIRLGPGGIGIAPGERGLPRARPQGGAAASAAGSGRRGGGTHD